MLYNESTLRSAIPDHKTVNRFIESNGYAFLVFGMTSDWVLVQRCFMKEGGLCFKRMMKIRYNEVKGIIEKPTELDNNGKLINNG